MITHNDGMRRQDRRKQEAGGASDAPVFRTDPGLEAAVDREIGVKLRLIEALAYQLTGRQIKAQALKQGQDVLWDAQVPSFHERDSWGLAYEYQEAIAEGDSICFNCGGTILKDGKTVMFSAEFTMYRSYYEQNRVNIRLGNAVMVDPLMMTVGDVGPEQVLPFDSGSERVWLAAYDWDRGAWVVSEDDVFSRLSMQPDPVDDSKTWVMLAHAGRGSIYLSEMETPFESEATADQYDNRRNGLVFLREDGSVQSLDLNP